MKKKIFIMVLGFVLLFSLKTYAADGPELEAIVNGKVDKGEAIQILINIKDIQSFYAGSMEFKYDKSILKVKSIEQGDLISKAGIDKFDAMNKNDEQNGVASYAFSCLGKINGFSGTGTFVKINAEILKKDSFHVRSKPFLKQVDDNFNLKLQICDSNIKELEYSFKPYEFNLTESSGSNNSNNNNITTNNTTGININNTAESTDNIKDKTAEINKAAEIATTTETNKSNTASPKTDSTSNKAVNEIGDPSNVKKEVAASDKNINTKADNMAGEGKSKSIKISGIVIACIISIAAIVGYLFYRKRGIVK